MIYSNPIFTFPGLEIQFLMCRHSPCCLRFCHGRPFNFRSVLLRKVPCQMEIWWQAYVSEQHLLVERQTLRNNPYQLHTYLVVLVPFSRDLLTVSECVSCTLDSLRQLEPGLWVETQPGLSVTFPHLWFLIAYSINKMVLNAVSDQKLEVGRLRNKDTGSVSLRDSATAHTVMQHWYVLHV